MMCLYSKARSPARETFISQQHRHNSALSRFETDGERIHVPGLPSTGTDIVMTREGSTRLLPRAGMRKKRVLGLSRGEYSGVSDAVAFEILPPPVDQGDICVRETVKLTIFHHLNGFMRAVLNEVLSIAIGEF